MHETMFERRTFPGGSFLKVFMTACYPGLAFSALVRKLEFSVYHEMIVTEMQFVLCFVRNVNVAYIWCFKTIL